MNLSMLQLKKSEKNHMERLDIRVWLRISSSNTIGYGVMARNQVGSVLYYMGRAK
jgi:hypothetical protein